MARDRQCASWLSNLDSGSPLNHCITLVLEAGVKVGWGLFHRSRKMVFQLWQVLVSLCSWQELGLCTCPNLIDPFHIASS